MSARLGVCSWSLQPSSAEELAQRVRACGLAHVQLALDPLRTGAWEETSTRETLAAADVELLSGMMGMEGEDYSTLESIRATGGVRPSAHWEKNLAAARANAELAQRLGLELVTLHAGFLPEEPEDPERELLMERLRMLIDVFAERDLRVGLETGQESAETLLGVLKELNRPGEVGVNFDPANMVLYGMGDPVKALQALLPHVLQVHIKDATPTEIPGTWGAEVPAGTGAVNWDLFVSTLAVAERSIDLVIEREAGDQREADVRTAAALVRGWTQQSASGERSG